MRIINNKQISILSLIVVLFIALTLAPTGSKYNTYFVFAGGNDHDDKDDGNHASQIIAQVQRSTLIVR